MPQKVYNNVEGHRVVDNERVVEDVTSVWHTCDEKGGTTA